MTSTQREMWAKIIARVFYLVLVLFCTYKLGGWYWVGIAAGVWGLIPIRLFKDFKED